MLFVRYLSRRHYSVRLRDHCGLNSLDRLQINEITMSMKALIRIYNLLRKRERLKPVATKVLKTAIALYRDLIKILVVEIPTKAARVKYPIQSFQSMERSINNSDTSVSFHFRFQSFDAMRRIIKSFRLPTGKFRIKTYRTTAEEVLMVSLKRLAYPARWGDLAPYFPGRATRGRSHFFQSIRRLSVYRRASIRNWRRTWHGIC